MKSMCIKIGVYVSMCTLVRVEGRKIEGSFAFYSPHLLLAVNQGRVQFNTWGGYKALGNGGTILLSEALAVSLL